MAERKVNSELFNAGVALPGFLQRGVGPVINCRVSSRFRQLFTLALQKLSNMSVLRKSSGCKLSDCECEFLFEEIYPADMKCPCCRHHKGYHHRRYPAQVPAAQSIGGMDQQVLPAAVRSSQGVDTYTGLIVFTVLSSLICVSP